MAVAITINSFYRDNGAKAAERSMKRLERIAKDNGTVLTDSQRKSAVAIQKVATAGDKLKTVGSGMQTVGRSATKYISAPIIAASALSVNAFKDFDDAMNQSFAIMGDLDQQTKDKMSSVARTVATTTRTSHADAAQSYYFLASAGYDAQQSIKALPVVAKFAQAGMMDMETATSLAADAQTSLGLKSADAEKNMKGLARITDVLTQANNDANGSVQEFSEALTTKAGSALKVTHKSVEEGVAVLEVLASQGIKGANAGEALNQFLRDIPRAAAKNTDAFKKFGVSVFDTKGNLKSSAEIVKQFEDRLGGMSDKSKAAAFEQMGLNRGVQNVIKQLMGSSGAITEYENKLKAAGGATEAVANKQLKSAQAQFDLAKNKLTDAAIAAGPTIMNAITPAIKSVTQLAEAFSKLSPSTQQFIVKAALITAAVGPVISTVGSLTSGLGKLITSISSVAAATQANYIAQYGKQLSGAALAAQEATGASSLFGKVLLSLPLGTAVGAIGGVITAVSLLTTAYVAHNINADAARSSIRQIGNAGDAAAGALDRYRAAVDRVANADTALAGARIAKTSASLGVQQAEKDYANAVKTSGKNSLVAKLAYNNLESAKLTLKTATSDLAKAEKEAKAAKDEYNTSRVDKFRKNLNLLRTAQKGYNTDVKSGEMTSKQRAQLEAKNFSLIKAGSEKNYNALKSQYARVDSMIKSGAYSKQYGSKVKKDLNAMYMSGLELSRLYGTKNAQEYAKKIASGQMTVEEAVKKLEASFGKGKSDKAKKAGKKQASDFSRGVRQGEGAAKTAASKVSKSGTPKANTSGSASSGKKQASSYAKGVSSGRGAAQAAGSVVSKSATSSMNKTNGAQSSGKHVAAGFANGITLGKYSVITAAKNLVVNAINAIKSKAGINSPARLFYAPGKYISLGLAKGISSGKSAIEKAAEKAAQSAYDKVQAIVQRNKDRVARGKEIANSWGLFSNPLIDGANSAGTNVNQASSWGMFNSPSGSDTKTVTTALTLSSGSWGTMTEEVNKSLIDIAQEQVDVLEQWTKNVSVIESSGASADFVKSIRDAGADNYEQVAQLANMTASEIKRFSDLWTKRQSYNTTTDNSATPQSLVDAMKAQNTVLNQWNADLKTIQKNGASKGLMSSLREAGPTEYSQVSLIAKMTAAQLKQYNDYYNKNQSLGQNLAQQQLGKVENTNITIKQGAVSVTIHEAGKMSEAKLKKEIMDAIIEALKKKKK